MLLGYCETDRSPKVPTKHNILRCQDAFKMIRITTWISLPTANKKEIKSDTFKRLKHNSESTTLSDDNMVF
jgi:hypothetical protein